MRVDADFLHDSAPSAFVLATGNLFCDKRYALEMCPEDVLTDHDGACALAGAEAREDVIVVLHALSDHRRTLYVDRIDETVVAPPEFMMLVSYNPGYRQALQELKPSTRQRFVSLLFGYPAPEIEAEIVCAESGVEPSHARRLVSLAGKIRALEELGLAETVSTRLLIGAGSLIRRGLPPRLACNVAVVQPLTDDAVTAAALQDVADLLF